MALLNVELRRAAARRLVRVLVVLALGGAVLMSVLLLRQLREGAGVDCRRAGCGPDRDDRRPGPGRARSGCPRHDWESELRHDR